MPYQEFTSKDNDQNNGKQANQVNLSKLACVAFAGYD